MTALLAGVACLAVTSPARAQNPRIGWSTLDAVVNRSIAAGEIPGAVVLVGHNGKVVFRKAFGERALRPRREKMTVSTIFDLASLTKVVATAPAIMQLLQQGRFRLNDPVAKYLPKFKQNGKDQITIRELLTHYSGLPPDLPAEPHWSGYAGGVAQAEAVKPESPPGVRFEYSDINYVILAELVRHFSGERIDRYALRHIFQPLGMSHTRYLPPASWRPRIAPTERMAGGRYDRGLVNDPTASKMGGVTGDAGVFSDADDLAKFAQMMLNGGRGANGREILTPLSVAKMTTPQTPFNVPAIRGLGWDIDSPFSSNRGAFLPVGSYGHTGFTGTSMWIDPTSKTYIIILSNAVHPSEKPPMKSILALRSEVATVVASVLDLNNPTMFARVEEGLERITGYNDTAVGERQEIARNGAVETGLDVLEEENFRPLRGKRVGLITNPTGVDREGKRNLDAMLAAGIQVTAGFSPEHGWSGNLNGPVGNARDAKTGIPVFSAYGSDDAERTLPAAGLKLVNQLVYDIQDVGVRFYTFETTLAYTLEAAKAHHLPVMVLDRPDPLDGIHVQGPPLAAAEKSFVGYYPGMPVRNGMTIGELARLFNHTIGADLTVIRMHGWRRGDYYDETGLPWVNPSPNLRDLTETVLYPGVALVEQTNVSVGRGTDRPFEVLGAPWMNGLDLATALNARRIPGVRFIPMDFTPASDKYAHQLCHGVSLVLTDREALDAPEMGVEIASALAQLYPQQWDSTAMPRLAGSSELVKAIRAGEDPRRLDADWQDADKAFEKLREPYLLYR